MPAFLPDDDEFVRHVCRLVAGDPFAGDPNAEAIKVCQYLTGVRPGKATQLVAEYLEPDDPLDVLVRDFPKACVAMGEVRDAKLLDPPVWRVLTVRRDRKALEAAGIGFTFG